MEALEDLAAVAADSSGQEAQVEQGRQQRLLDLLLCIISNKDHNISKPLLRLPDLVAWAVAV